MAKKNQKIINTAKQKSQQKQVVIDNRKNYIYLGITIFLTLIVYISSFKNGFVNWDDNKYIIENPYIKNFSIEGIKTIFTSFWHSNYHPLTTVIYAFEYSLFAQNPMPYHIINVFIHFINIILVFYLMLNVLKSSELAFIISLLFAVHPMHVESVVWISELKDLMYSFFFLISIMFYVKYIEGEKVKDKKETSINYFVSFFMFLLSLFSKSAAVTLPVALFVFDYYYSRKVSVKLILEKLPFIFLSVLFGILAIKSQSADNAIVNVNNLFSITDRFFLVTYAISFYIVKLIFPFNLSTLHYYPLNYGTTLPAEYLIAPLFILLIIFVVYKYKKLQKEMIFGLLFFLINISLVLQIIPVGQALVAERYTYIPYLGLFFIIAKIYQQFAKTKTKTVFIYALTIFILMFSVLSYSRTLVWKNGIVLFDDVIEKSPKVFYGYSTRGDAKSNAKDYKGAIEDYTKSIELQSNYADAYYSRGRAYHYLQQYDLAINDYTKSLLYKPNFPETYSNRAASYFSIGRLKETIDDCNIAIKLKPDYAEAYVNRGNAKGVMKDYVGSIEDFNTSIKLNPTISEAYLNRGFSELNLNKKQQACEDFTKALSLGNPNAQQIIDKNCK